MEVSVYLVPHMDVAWDGWGPVDPLTEYGNPPPPLDKMEADLRRTITFAQEELGGKLSLGPHCSTYYRELFYREPFLSLYRELVRGGGEIVVHTHEELIATSPPVHAEEHMRAIILRKRDELATVGIQPTAFRMGLWAFNGCIPPILEEAGIYVDLSGAPGLDRWYWHARWANAPRSAYYLCRGDHTQLDCLRSKTKVLEIPLGTDSLGDDLSRDLLYVEAVTLDELERVWDAIVERAETAGEPQFVHFLCHLWSVGRRDLLARLRGFVRYAQSHGGAIVTPSQAKRTYDMRQS